MIKRVISLILALSIIFGVPILTLCGSKNQLNLIINGVELERENKICIDEEGYIMLPLRLIFEKLNYQVKWKEKENKVQVYNEGKEIEFKIGEYNSFIKNGRTFISLEHLNEKSDLIIGLDKNHQNIKINKFEENKEEYFKDSKDIQVSNGLNDYMEMLEKHQNFYGSVLVSKNGQILLNKGYGYSNLNQKIKNKAKTKFGIGSITKQFTAVGIMQLVEKDLIKVEDKISKHIPDAPYGEELTIYNLLTHTSGLSNYTNLKEFINDENKDREPKELVKSIENIPLKFIPGEEFEYNNTGYLLLGMIIENVSGKTFEEYINTNIFKPLNMKDTGISYGKNNEYPDATPYTGNLYVKPVDDEVVLSQSYGAGSMYSTVEDLYRWERSLNSEMLIKKESLKEIFKEHVSMGGEASYGYGFMIEDTEVGKKYYHSGNTFGYSSNISRYVDEDLTIITLVNKAVYDVEKLTEALTNISLGKDYGF